ncbi:hypothetical protein HMPREF1155_0185 [Slackia sp. CM382]|nr:hypothetical protein HMPREF1155_0185 [Slackia sp. CM382]
MHGVLLGARERVHDARLGRAAVVSSGLRAIISSRRRCLVILKDSLRYVYACGASRARVVCCDACVRPDGSFRNRGRTRAACTPRSPHGVALTRTVPIWD